MSYGPAGSFPLAALPSWLDADLARQEREIAERERVRLLREAEEDEELLLLTTAISWEEE